jgi:hypothetical protein
MHGSEAGRNDGAGRTITEIVPLRMLGVRAGTSRAHVRQAIGRGLAAFLAAYGVPDVACGSQRPAARLLHNADR